MGVNRERDIHVGVAEHRAYFRYRSPAHDVNRRATVPQAVNRKPFQLFIGFSILVRLLDCSIHSEPRRLSMLR